MIVEHRIDCDMDEDCNCTAGDEPRVLRALTFRAPWLSLVLANAAAFPGVGSKWIENRPRGPGRLIGEVIALHNGLGFDVMPAEIRALHNIAVALPFCPPGHIVGLARVVGNVGPLRGAELWDGGKSRFASTEDLHRATVKSPWFFGPNAWALDERVLLPRPVPCSGNQIYGWIVPPDVAAQVLEQVM